jgi:hypothetical protein
MVQTENLNVISYQRSKKYRVCRNDGTIWTVCVGDVKKVSNQYKLSHTYTCSPSNYLHIWSTPELIQGHKFVIVVVSQAVRNVWGPSTLFCLQNESYQIWVINASSDINTTLLSIKFWENMLPHWVYLVHKF